MKKITKWKQIKFLRFLRDLFIINQYLKYISTFIENRYVKCSQNDYELAILGGKLIAKSRLKQNQVVVSAGVGTDLNFELEVISRLGNTVLAIDPTEVSANYIARARAVNCKKLEKLRFVNKALTKDGEPIIFYSGDGDRMASTSATHSIGNSNSMTFESVSLEELQSIEDIGYLKLDIEGYEYVLLESLTKPLTIPQIAIEFHLFCIDERTLTETIKWIETIISWGYTAIDYGAWAGRTRNIPKYSALFTDTNVELLFIRNDF